MSMPKARAHEPGHERDRSKETPTDTVREHGRGRLAEGPSEIPARGWWDILLRIYGNFSHHRVLALAAGMTYYSLLAIFPAIAALVAIYGLFSNPATISSHLDEVSGILPRGPRRGSRPTYPRGLAGNADARLDFLDSPRRVALERKRSNEVIARYAQHRLWRRREARLDQAKRGLSFFYGRRDTFRTGRDRCGSSFANLAPIPRSFSVSRRYSPYWTLAGTFGHDRAGIELDLSVRAQQGGGALAMDHVGKRFCCDPMASRIGAVFLLHGSFRQLQQNLWLVRCGDRLHGLDVDLGNYDSPWSGVGR